MSKRSLYNNLISMHILNISSEITNNNFFYKFDLFTLIKKIFFAACKLIEKIEKVTLVM